MSTSATHDVKRVVTQLMSRVQEVPKYLAKQPEGGVT